MDYKVIDKTQYYRAGVYRHFTDECKCSASMTARIDVSQLVEYSKQTGTKFYINFLYIISRVLNSRDDYRMGYLSQTKELICYDQINPTQYIFHEDTETCTPVSVRLNHAVADVFLVGNVFRLLEKEIDVFCDKRKQHYE